MKDCQHCPDDKGKKFDRAAVAECGPAERDKPCFVAENVKK